MGQRESLDELRLGYWTAPHLYHERSMLVAGVEQIKTAALSPTGGGECIRSGIYNQLAVDPAWCRTVRPGQDMLPVMRGERGRRKY